MKAGILSRTTIEAVDQADAAADRHAAEDGDRHRQGHRGHQLRADHRAEAGHRADRKIELAIDQEDGLADGDDADEGNDGQDRADVPLGQEGRLQDVEEGDDDDERGEHPDLADRRRVARAGRQTGRAPIRLARRRSCLATSSSRRRLRFCRRLHWLVAL